MALSKVVVGPTSIGWALINQAEQKIVASGVRVFPEGLDRDKSGGEVSKNENRRIRRGMRRQLRRRAKRKQFLKDSLVRHGLLPDQVLLQPDHPERVKWESEAFQTADPYELRARGVIAQLEPFEIGRNLAAFIFSDPTQLRAFLPDGANCLIDNWSSLSFECKCRLATASIVQIAGDVAALASAGVGLAKLINKLANKLRRGISKPSPSMGGKGSGDLSPK